jgi:branched-chain amino acid transport system permease protein
MTGRDLALHLGLIAALFVAQYLLPPYHHTSVARVMVLAIFAMGYNIGFGYTGLLSLGHALFFGTGVYAAGLGIVHLGLSPGQGLIASLVLGCAMAGIVGVLALRTAGVSFMIVTLMFAQAGYLTALYFGTWTRGDEGFVLQGAQRLLWGLDLTQPGPRYGVALGLFGLALIGNLALVRSRFGRVMIAMRENEERSRMLGYSPFRVKLLALMLSGLYAGAAGGAYALLFGYVGATFAEIQYSILPLLYALLGGAGTVIGPFIGALAMFYLIDLSSSVTTAHLLVVGVALLALILFAPKGILGTIRERFARWLP